MYSKVGFWLGRQGTQQNSQLVDCKVIFSTPGYANLCWDYFLLEYHTTTKRSFFYCHRGLTSVCFLLTDLLQRLGHILAKNIACISQQILSSSKNKVCPLLLVTLGNHLDKTSRMGSQERLLQPSPNFLGNINRFDP